MADLITTQELATWTQTPLAELEADPLALDIMEKVSGLARFLGGNDLWELAPVLSEDAVPYDVRLVVLMVAKRCYENPRQVVVEGAVGPIGGDKVLDVAALLLELTEAERATLVKYNANGDPDSAAAAGLFVLQGSTRPETQIDAVLYVPDDSLSDWYIPMFEDGDPGDPNLYPEG